ncbi:MAG: C40 family peptidase [Planctomycetaceae bacterium]
MNATGGRFVRLVAATSIVASGIVGPLAASATTASASPSHAKKRHGLERRLERAVEAYNAANSRLGRIQARLDAAGPGRHPALTRARRHDLGLLARERARIEEFLATSDRLYRTLTGRPQAYLDAIAARPARRQRSTAVRTRASAATIALAAARSALGAPYVYGAAGPGAFDCSGLTMWAYAQAGVAMPHSASAQYAAFPRVSLSALRPGDIVYYGNYGPHVALYLGDGMIIHATHPGPGGGVHIDSLYGYDRPWGAVRPA